MRARGLMARALLRRAKVSVRDRLRLPDGLRAFAQGSYKVSLRWRGGCPCGHQFYMPPAGGENHTTGLRPMENKPTALGAMETHPLFPRSGIGGGAALAASSRRLVFITVVPNAACTEILRCAQNDEKGGKVSEKVSSPEWQGGAFAPERGISLVPKARFYCFPAAGGSIYSSPRSGDTTTLGPKGPVKSENLPANGTSNLRTFFKIPLLLKAKSFIITMIYYCFAICGTGTKEILEV